ncbi:MAG: hypothetical protein EXX96DRAFT_466534, partial [Benjaminiella poitrasii]
VLKFVKENWRDNSKLELEVLQKKTLILLCLANMWRPLSDLRSLQWRDIAFQPAENTSTPSGVTLLARTPKEGQAKLSKLGCILDPAICPVCTLYYFCQTTSILRQDFRENHTLFLAYIQHPHRKPFSASPATVANWVK